MAPNQYICSYCSSAFNKKSNLLRRSLVHTGEISMWNMWIHTGESLLQILWKANTSEYIPESAFQSKGCVKRFTKLAGPSGQSRRRGRCLRALRECRSPAQLMFRWDQCFSTDDVFFCFFGKINVLCKKKKNQIGTDPFIGR